MMRCAKIGGESGSVPADRALHVGFLDLGGADSDARSIVGCLAVAPIWGVSGCRNFRVLQNSPNAQLEPLGLGRSPRATVPVRTRRATVADRSDLALSLSLSQRLSSSMRLPAPLHYLPAVAKGRRVTPLSLLSVSFDQYAPGPGVLFFLISRS